MIKISNVVRQLVSQSEEALIALNEGYLNLSAYAKKIQKAVEAECKKPVKMGSIVAALNRLKGKIATNVPSRSKLVIDDLVVKTGLTELTYENTSEIANKTKNIYLAGKINSEGILFVCHGIREVSFFVYEKNRKAVEDFLKKQKTKFTKNNLVSLTVRLADEAIPYPNHTYTIFRALVMKKISVIDNITTYSELTFILDEKDLHTAMEAINDLMKR